MTRGGARKGAGRRPTVGASGTIKIWNIRVPSDVEKRIGKWAKAQPDKPAKSEAARRLWDDALTRAGF
jgi:hypothetical protein